VDKIICVGKNYLAHAAEMNEKAPELPILFFKPPSCLFRAEKDGPLKLPSSAGIIHHELELVFKIQKDSSGGLSFSHWTLGLDLTAREVQKELKSHGHPWERAKAFPRSAVVGEFLPLSDFDSLLDRPFELFVNGELKQRGYGKDMRWSPKALLEDLNHHFEIRDGDLLFTGTPEGVGPLAIGDQLIVKMTGAIEFTLDLV